MRLGGAVIMMGDPGPDYRGPGRRGGATVQIHVQVDDVDSLCRRAREAGAIITAEPEDHTYDRIEAMTAFFAEQKWDRQSVDRD